MRGELSNWGLIVGLLQEAGRLLESDERAFVGDPGATGAAWTLRDAMLTALGCHRRAGTLAYWEWRELHAALQAARELLHAHTGAPPQMDAERWANQPSRTLDEVLAAIEAVPEEQDVDVAASVSLRPWCDPTTAGKCRIPFVPLACLVHGWGDPTRGWSATADRLGLTPASTSWDVLDRLEPEIRGVPAPEATAASAWALRRWMGLDETATSPVRWLFDVTADDPTASLSKLTERAEGAIKASEAAKA